MNNALMSDPTIVESELPDQLRSLEFRVLGPLEMRAGEVVLPIAGARQRTVLAMLLTAAGRVVPVDTLVEAVWDGHPPVTGRTQVAICVAGLRKTCKAAGAGEVVVTASPGYRLVTDPHRLDATEFSARVEQARSFARAQRVERAVAAFREALAMWRGRALVNIRSELVRAAAARLEEERLSAYEQYTALRLELGQHRALIGELTDLVRQQPTWEQARAHLMLAHYRCGRRAEALEVFRQGRSYSIAELGLEPGPVLSDLHTAVLRDDPGLAMPSGPAVVSAAVDVVPAQLPPDEPAFTGRRRELDQLDDALLGDRGRNRPLRWGQLSGGVGVGKTALAVHWAHRVAAEFPDGQLFVDLRGYDPHREPVRAAAVLDDFIRALGRPPEQVPEGIDARVAFYHSLLAERRMLIVLDNARSYAQIQPLLPGSGNCRVIVTGRETLDGPAAVRIRLAELDGGESTALLRRAVGDARVAADATAVAWLGELCDGLPLALRSAAARLAAKPHWSVGELAHRLADGQRRLTELDPGDTGLTAGFWLTYQSLPADAASMFRRLTLLSAHEVAAADAAPLLAIGPSAAEDLLERLVDAHLLEVGRRDEQGRRRFRLRGLRRLYAQQRAGLDDSPSDHRDVQERLSPAEAG
ncbi:AfsR/SARP family transcriptional regulator [Natronosporangium hydrolyticum]|uniref:AfsR/SARP family transcriptional regulator n=1 Tax=Natronosporangium hydrolyticum TaxID=2811111 RepID=A0A895YFE9_9ACTN|nr:AfsR/SARP family transcriptional regulator [Natronosporangium hydrolyticum]QSB16311.1 AfsR/SARP family transcriptional regulator [Natronosporangium hydrolyticum]